MNTEELKKWLSLQFNALRVYESNGKVDRAEELLDDMATMIELEKSIKYQEGKAEGIKEMTQTALRVWGTPRGSL